MFEKAKPQPAHFVAPERDPATGNASGRFAARRGGDALRALEWSELTARLNAARDLRNLMRSDSQAPIEAAAASFGDAAASYFALLDHDEPDFNLDALGQWKGPDVHDRASDANRRFAIRQTPSDAPRRAARDK